MPSGYESLTPDTSRTILHGQRGFIRAMRAQIPEYNIFISTTMNEPSGYIIESAIRRMFLIEQDD
jgi:hypothetical protein